MSSVKLLNRSCTVTVGTVQIQNVGAQIGLDVWFSIRRSLKAKEPNTCDLRLYNLSDGSRKAIEQSGQALPGAATAPGTTSKVVPVQIVAGYVGATTTLFLGEMRTGQTVTDGPDGVTELTTGDGDQAAILARSTASFAKGGNAYNVSLQLLKDMGIGNGNLATVAEVLKGSPLFNQGVVLKGNSLQHLIDIARSCALEVSIQNGVAQWTPLGQPLQGEATLLSSDTGLIGSPTVDTKGVLSFECLMLPGIKPGAPVQMQAKYLQGLYRIVSVETEGSSFGNDWSHKVEAKRYGLSVN